MPFGWDPVPGGGWTKTSITPDVIPPNFVQQQLAQQYQAYGAPGQTPPSWVTPKPAYQRPGSDPFAAMYVKGQRQPLFSPQIGGRKVEGVYHPYEDIPAWTTNYYTQLAKSLAMYKGNPPEGQTWAAPNLAELGQPNYTEYLKNQYPDIYEPSTMPVSPFVNPDTITPEDVAKMLGLDMGAGVEGTKPVQGIKPVVTTKTPPPEGTVPSEYGANWVRDTNNNLWYLSDDNQWYQYEEPTAGTSEAPTFQPAGGQTQDITGQPIGKAGMSYGQRLASKGDMGLPKSFAAPTPVPTADEATAILQGEGTTEGGTTETTDDYFAKPATKRILIEDPVGSGKYWYKHLQYNTKTGNWDTAQISLEPAASPFPEKKDISYQHFVGKDGAIYSFNPITRETKVLIPAPDISKSKTHQWPNPDGTMQDVTEGVFDSMKYLAEQKLNAEQKAITQAKTAFDRNQILVNMAREMTQLNYANKWNEYRERVRQEEVRQKRVTGEQESFQAYMLGAQGQGIAAGNLATKAQEAQNTAQQERINAAQAAENLRQRLELEYATLPFKRMGQQQPVSYRPYRQ